MNKVLVLSGDYHGVGYYRLFMPHICMNEKDFKFDIRMLYTAENILLDVNFLKYYSIIIFNKTLPFVNRQHVDAFFNICKSLNIKVLYDIDDYWELYPEHLNYKNWKNSNSKEEVLYLIKKSDVVITTTTLFAEKIKEYNKNVIVLENAINIKEQQWQSNKKPSEKVRFLWGGGIQHIIDIRLLKESFKKFDKEFLSKCQLYLCGYDLRIKNKNIILKDSRERNVWTHFEMIFTNDYKYIETYEYKKFLLTSDNLDINEKTYGYREEFKDMFYQRRHTKDILNFGTMYNEADVVLAPLKNNNSFNYVKSHLKLIEAGCHRCPVIMSNYGPYTLHDIQGEKTSLQKGFLVNENESDWYEKMRWYLKNKSAIKEHGEANYEYFINNFELSIVNKKRIDFYRYVINKNKETIKI